MSGDLCRLSASALAPLLARGEVSTVELIQTVLARIERLQPQLYCFITVAAESALDAARAADRARSGGKLLGPLHGVPFTAKDLVDSAGIRTTYGSRLFANNVPARDAVAIARLRAAGAILVGKTTTPEFGHKPFTAAPLFGRTCNAWNPQRTSGGSSGGAAVAVAAGLAPLAIATDGGGSTRIPAACNGVVGLKQSLGLIAHNQAPDPFGAITYVTPTTRTVADTGLMLNAMAGAHPSDPWAYDPSDDFAAAAQARPSLAGIRVLILRRIGDAPLSADVAQAFDGAFAALQELCAELEELGEPVEALEPLWRVINHATWRVRFSNLVAGQRHLMTPTLVRQVEEAAAYSADDLMRANVARGALFRRVQRWFERADLVITPTLTRSAVSIDLDLFDPIEVDGQRFDEIRNAWYPYTMPFNLTGHPAITLPMGRGGYGLPLALQLIGRPRADAELLGIAATVEARLAWDGSAALD